MHTRTLVTTLACGVVWPCRYDFMLMPAHPFLFERHATRGIRHTDQQVEGVSRVLSPLPGTPVAVNVEAIDEAVLDGEPMEWDTWLLELKIDPVVAAEACACAEAGAGAGAGAGTVGLAMEQPLLTEEAYAQVLQGLDPALFGDSGFSGQHFP